MAWRPMRGVKGLLVVRLPSGDWEMDRRFLTEPASDGEVDNDSRDARGGRFSSAGAGASSGIFSSMKPTLFGRCGGTKMVVLWSAAAWPAATTFARRPAAAPARGSSSFGR